MAVYSCAKAPDKASLMLAVYAGLSLIGGGLMLLGNLNSTLFILINHFASQHLPAPFLEAVTLLGEGLWLLSLLAPLLLIAPRVNVALLYAAPFALLVTHVPKLLLHLPRPGSLPSAAHLLDAPIGRDTFPSGHAVIAGLVAAAVILTSDFVRRRSWMALIVLALASLIACSRIAVGAHWPLDVLVGLPLGIGAGAAGAWLTDRLYRHSPKAQLTVAAIYLVGAIALVLFPVHLWAQVLARDMLVAVGAVSAVAAGAQASLTGMRGARAKPESARALSIQGDPSSG